MCTQLFFFLGNEKMICWQYLVVSVLSIVLTIILFVYIHRYNKIDYSVVIPKNRHDFDAQIESYYFSQRCLLIWRISCCILVVITSYSLYTLMPTWFVFASYTAWNYIIFAMYYGVNVFIIL